MGRHQIVPARRRGITAALAVSCVALGGLITLGLSADGQTSQVSGDQTCQFSIAGGVVSTLACTAATTAPPSTSSSPTAAPTTPAPTKTSPPPTSPPTSPSPTMTETPTQLPTGPAGGAFPDASNTGVPSGVSLTAYTGSKTISTCQVIDGKTLTGDFTVTASSGTSDLSKPCVMIRNSKLNGTITTGAWPNTTKGPTLIEDTEINAGTDADPSVVFGDNVFLLRDTVHGGKANLQCADINCRAQDSYFHQPYLVGSYHYDVIGSNGASGIDLEHNTVDCSFDYPNSGSGSGGCSADIGFFGDSGTIENVTVNHNLFMGEGIQKGAEPGFCLITNANKPGKAFAVGKNLTITNNVFQKGKNGNCGQYGPVDEWQSGNGNVWSGNTWDDGSALNE